MKKTFLAFLCTAIIFYAKQVHAQCAVTDVIFNIRQSVTDPNNPGNCLVTFDMKFNIDANNGFKITVLQAWPEQDYPGYWKNACMPSNSAPTQTDLRKDGTGSLPFINLAYETNGNTFTPLTQYIDATVPLNTGYTISTGSPVLGFIPVTITNITISIPGGCRGITIRADIWGTQGSPTSQWKPHCVSCNHAYAFNYPWLQGFQDCILLNNQVQRTYRFTVKNTNTNQTITLNSYSVYRDDNLSGSFDPDDDVRVGFDQTQRVLLPNDSFAIDPTTYEGNMGTTRDQKLFVVLDVLGVINDIFTACAQVSCGSLPVRFTSFQAQIKSGRARLYWSTATEQQNKGFEIERRTDHTAFQPIGFVASKAFNGNSSSVLHYEFADETIQKPGRVYYRLKQIDYDGKYAYSDVKNVYLTFPAKVSVFPNPSSGNISILVPPTISKYDLILSDQHGNHLRRWINARSSFVQIAQLRPGIYWLTLHDPEQQKRFTERIVVQ